RLAKFFAALAVAVNVEGGHDFETFRLETTIREQGHAEMACADEDDWLQAGRAEQIGNHFGQLLYIVPQSPGAELAEVGQVFTQLGGFDPGRFSQGLTGDRADGIALQTLQAAQIDREPINRFARYFRSNGFFQT